MNYDLLFNLYVTERKSTTAIANELGITRGKVYGMLKRLDVPLRSNKEGQRVYFNDNVNIDESFFEKETPELFYILGLWATDGSICNRRMELALTDYDVIKWVADKIKYKNTIMKRETVGKDVYRVSFYSEKALDFFTKYEVTERKSFSLKFPHIPKDYVKDFIRGSFDGDGCIHICKRKDRNNNVEQRISIVSASEDFINGIKSAIDEAIGTDVKIRKKDASLYELYFAKRQDVINFGNWIYGGNSFGMTRKKEKFSELDKFKKEAIVCRE